VVRSRVARRGGQHALQPVARRRPAEVDHHALAEARRGGPGRRAWPGSCAADRGSRCHPAGSRPGGCGGGACRSPTPWDGRRIRAGGAP
jgi:hypothetical protein